MDGSAFEFDEIALLRAFSELGKSSERKVADFVGGLSGYRLRIRASVLVCFGFRRMYSTEFCEASFISR
jgi:hypothetical protein